MANIFSPNWETVSLGQLANFRNGINYSKDNFGEGIKVINVRDFQDHSIAKFNELDEINPEGLINEESLLKINDILFVRSNGNRNLIGRSMFVKDIDEPIAYSAFSIRLRFESPLVEPRFYAYLFRTPLIRQVLSTRGIGTNISNLNQQILSNLEVPIPPLHIQCKITAVLSAYDDLIENNTRRIAILEEMAQTLYREWFVHFRFPGHEDMKMVDVGGNGGYGRLPKGWEIVQLGDERFTKLISRGYQPKYDEDSDCRVINQRCIRDHKIDLSLTRGNDEVKRPISKTERFVQFGDILINSTGTGTLGRVAQVYENLEKHTVDSHVTIVRPTDERLIDYLGVMFWELESFIEQLGTGATNQTELSQNRITTIEITVAPIALQKRFSSIVRPIRRQLQILLKKNANLRQTRDLLLPRLISGELDVSQLEIAIPS